MTFRRRIRLIAGALLYDWLPFERRLRGFGAKAGQPEPWLSIRNRLDHVSSDGRGFRCEWRFVHDLHIANVLPSTGKRLMRVALARWPVTLAEGPRNAGAPAATFVIGHRGLERLPHLLATLRSIAGQNVPVECIVVEQSPAPEIGPTLPPWVRYLHTPVPRDLPYCRSWTLNAGVRHALSDVVILHDNDIVVPEAYAAEAVARVAEGWRFANLKRFTFYLAPNDSARVFSSGSVSPSVATVVQNLHGASIVADRAAYEAIGGYDESFIGWGGEDNDFWDRAATTERIYDFGYLPMIHLHHEDQPGKRTRDTAAIARYKELEAIPPRERIARLLSRGRGCDDAPSAG
jgi:hypothetical protein